jgi:hypothetical protein
MFNIFMKNRARHRGYIYLSLRIFLSSDDTQFIFLFGKGARHQGRIYSSIKKIITIK